MGKRGPKPKPTAEKKRLGNPGRRPLNDSEPEPTGQPNEPDWLDDYAKQVWNRVILSMADGVFTRCDTGTLAAYCRAESMLRSAAYVNQLGRYNAYRAGYITNGAYSDTNAKDWLRIEKEQAAAVASLGTRLGLDPSARTAIKVPENKKGGKFSQFKQIKGGKG